MHLFTLPYGTLRTSGSTFTATEHIMQVCSLSKQEQIKSKNIEIQLN